MAKTNRVAILGNNKYMPLWYTLSCSSNSLGNALEMANLFYESGKFAAAEPDFLIDNISLTSPNDPHFLKQWGLVNTGQNSGLAESDGIAGIDIRFEEVSQITSGSTDVVIAVIDDGIVFSHPDLTDANRLYGYDTETEGLATVYNKHGTACTGIIAASANNEIGITGIAPSCKIMPISHSLNGETDNAKQQLANGISYAWEHGADVINNSWGHNTLVSSYIDDAIHNALTLGREGKGCVVVFATGNENTSPVMYPSTVAGVISVGAISPCGERKSIHSCDNVFNWGSNYGLELDIVAPGTLIPSTSFDLPFNPITYVYRYINFGGTSAAAPHVSAIAALMLSVNPTLTQQQVKNIIEQTAQKVRLDLYDYTTVEGYPNGTWHSEMGYGLVDAYASVMAAIGYSEADLCIRDTLSDNGTEPSLVQAMWNSPDIWIEDMSGNIVDNPHGNMEYKVCVRIHNRNNIMTDGTQKLYLNWAKAGIDLRWNHHWTGEEQYNCSDRFAPKGGVIGNASGVEIGMIPAYGSKVVKVTWSVPRAEDYQYCTQFASDLWHFCLLARVHDDDDIVDENASNASMGQFVTRNNNVAWKNLSVLNSQHSRATVSISNLYDIPHSFKVKYNTYPNAKGEKISNFAEVYLTLSNDLAAQWQGAGTGFKRVKENQILVLNDEVVLTGVVMQPNKLYTLETHVSFLTQKTPLNNEFHFDIALYDNNMKLIGGEHYIAIKDNERDFEAIALDDVTLLSSQPATFTATSINEEASYTWFNQSGDTVALGTTLTATPTITQNYTLEVVASSDGAKDYDEVTATVRLGAINLISPNPATSNISVTYTLVENISDAQLQIVNIAGTVLSTIPVNGTTNPTTINVDNLSVGQYTLKLTSLSQGLLDTKSLIIQQ